MPPTAGLIRLMRSQSCLLARNVGHVIQGVTDSTYPILYEQSNDMDQIQTLIFNMSIKAQSVAHAQLLGLAYEGFTYLIQSGQVLLKI